MGLGMAGQTALKIHLAVIEARDSVPLEKWFSSYRFEAPLGLHNPFSGVACQTFILEFLTAAKLRL